MKGLPKVLIIIAVLLIGYSVTGRLIGQQLICLGLINIKPASALIAANSLILLAIAIKLFKE